MTRAGIGQNGQAFPWWKQLRYRAGEKRLRAPIIWWRHRGVTPADVFVGSYPRSGYTWLRFMIYGATTGECADFRRVNDELRYVGEHARGRGLLPGRGRLISTHEVYRPEYRRAIYVVRDIRSVVVSEFLREHAKGMVTSFDEYLAKLLSGGKRHGTWPEHVASWLNSETARRGDLLVLRYEDMRRQPEKTLAEAMTFLKLRRRFRGDSSSGRRQHDRADAGEGRRSAGSEGESGAPAFSRNRRRKRPLRAQRVARRVETVAKS